MARAWRRTGPASAWRLWTGLAVLAALAAALALSAGSVAVPPWQVPRLLWAPDGSAAAEVLHTLRLPRAQAAFATGGLLALAGALMQVLLRNPLADPYVLGLSGGAAAGALAALWAGWAAWAVQGGALTGALLTTALVYALAQRDLARLSAVGSQEHAPRLLLTGVMLAAGWGALIALMLALAPQAQLRGMLFWLAGDLSGSTGGAGATVLLVALLALSWPLARDLNVLLRGTGVAQSLGVRVRPLQAAVYLLASLAAAGAVTTAGSVGFVGLVVPHALRLLIGNDQRVLLPAAVLAGGTLLLLADTLARTVVAPQQLPVGVVMALLGVPSFLWLLLRRPRR